MHNIEKQYFEQTQVNDYLNPAENEISKYITFLSLDIYLFSETRKKMVISIYGNIDSPFVQTVILVLKETNVPYKSVPLDTTKGESKTPEYLTKHPFGQVPLLVSIRVATLKSIPFSRIN